MTSPRKAAPRGRRGPRRGGWRLAGAALAVAAGVVIAIVVVAVVVTRPAPPRTPSVRPALPPPGGQSFGVNVNRLFNDFAYTATEVGAQLQAVRATGATIARSDALWEATEPQAPVAGRHRYDWGFDDTIAGSLAAHGLTWLPILDYTARWAQSVPGQDHSPPRSPADYAAYASAFAGRYGAGGSFWRQHPQLTPLPVRTIEIWNEPDNPEFWTPGPSPAAYASLYLGARNAIDAVDPSVRVIVGGLTSAPVFLPAMVRAQPRLRDHIDGVAIHPYGTPRVVLARVRDARATLVSLGMASVPLYVTEFGWTTEPPGALDYAPAARRDRYITSTLGALGHLGCGVAASLLYTWVTPERRISNSQSWYGIAEPDGGSTAATAAFAAGLRAATQPTGAPLACPR
ncbi:MAG TPA: hypothetical protein VG325_00620 [Solirubrobacteraceae bacterium]|jgi:hypothetical protein|nr:hypothetical protein [Solirubrobacteraceae bacterium]